MMRPTVTISIGALLLLLSVQGYCQHAGLTVPIEGVLSTPAGEIRIISSNSEVTPLESILGDPNNEWAKGQTERDLYQFNVEWGGIDGVSAKRNLSQQRVVAKDSPFDTAVRDTLDEGFQLSPFSGMSFSAGKQRTETFDLTSASLGASQVETIGLSQAYGSGATAGTMSFNRKVTEAYGTTEDQPFTASELLERSSENAFALRQGFLALGQPGTLELTHVYSSLDKRNQVTKRTTSDGLKLGMGLWAGTKLTAAYDQIDPERDTELQRLHRALSLSREATPGKVALDYDYTSQIVGATTTDTEVNNLALPFAINGTNVSMAYAATSTYVNDARMADKRSASFATKVAGNDVSASWDRDLQIKGGQEQLIANMALLVPMDVFGSKLTIDFKSNLQEAGGVVQKKLRAANLDLPLSQIREGAKFTYNVTATEDPKNPFRELRTATLAMPLTVGGAPVSTQMQQVSIAAPDGSYDQFNADLSAPVSMFGVKLDASDRYARLDRPDGSRQYQFSHKTSLPLSIGPIVFSGTTTTEHPLEGEERTAQTSSFVTPAVPLPMQSSFQADLTRNTAESGVEQRTTHMVMKSAPLKRVSLSADYTTAQTTADAKTKQHSRVLDASYAIADRLSLNARYLDREQLDKSPFINRTMVLQHTKDKPEDLALRAAITHTLDGTEQEQSPQILKLVDVEFGDPRILGFDLEYKEYDEAKSTALGEPTVGFGVKHGTAGSTTWEFGYEDSKGRAAPHRRWGLGLPMTGTLLSLGFSQNAMDPTLPADKAAVRMAEVYDASISRQLAGDVSLDVGYRYLDYDKTVEATTNSVAQYLQVKVAGGKPEGVGQIALGYASGDFITDATLRKKAEEVPHSVLSLTYDKQWSDTGKLSLQFDHKNMPDDRLSTLQDAYEGKVQFEYKF